MYMHMYIYIGRDRYDTIIIICVYLSSYVYIYIYIVLSKGILRARLLISFCAAFARIRRLRKSPQNLLVILHWQMTVSAKLRDSPQNFHKDLVIALSLILAVVVVVVVVVLLFSLLLASHSASQQARWPDLDILYNKMYNSIQYNYYKYVYIYI